MKTIIFHIFIFLASIFSSIGQIQKPITIDGQILESKIHNILLPMIHIGTSTANPILLEQENKTEQTNSIVIGKGTTINDNTFESLTGDNCMAIANNNVLIDTLVTVKNHSIHYYTQGGSPIKAISLDTFANPPLPGYTFGDPKILFDSDYNRFLLSYQAWNKTPLCKKSYIFLLASKSSNPMLGWSGYIIQDSDVVPDSLWLDRPDIGMSTGEIFLTAHAFKDSTQIFKRNAILSLRKDKLYNNQSDTIREVVIPNNPALYGLFPVSYGQGGNYGPGIYMIKTESVSGDSIWLYDITNHVYTHNFQIIKKATYRTHYSFPSNLRQKGSTVKMKTGTSRVLDAFYLDGNIHYVFAEYKSQSIESRISYNRLKINIIPYTNTSTAYANTGAAYPSLASFATTSTDKSVIIGFLTSDSLSFPSFHAISCDDNMNWGNDLLLAAGDTARLSTGWGDYTGTVRKHNASTAIAWTTGNYCHYNAIPWTSTYIAEIIKTGTTDIKSSLSSLGDISIFPNPTNNYFKINFLTEKNIDIKIYLYDILGHPINLLYKGNAAQLNMQLFNCNGYSKGTYIIYVMDNNNLIINHEKIFIN